MRKLSSYFNLLLFTAFVFTMSNVTAQEIALSNGYYFSEDRILPSVEAIFPESAEKVQQAFEYFTESTYNIDLQSANLGKQGNYLYAEDIILPALAKREVDLFVSVKNRQDASGSVMHFSVKQFNDDYVDKWYNPDTYTDMRNMVLGFMHYHYPNYYEQEMSERQAIIADLNTNANMIESEIDDTQEMIDKRYDQIRVLSRELVSMQQQMRALEMQMKTELNKLEKDQEVYLEIK